MDTKSIWYSFASETSFPSLKGSVEVDIAIIGGGITGISIAQQLCEKGYSVVILEAEKVGSGTTGESTGNLYTIIEEGLSSLEKKYDIGLVKTVIKARRDALDLIKMNITQFNIDCDYKEQSMFVFEENDDGYMDMDLQLLMKEDIPGVELQGENFEYKITKGIHYRNQAQFNPLLYVQALSKIVAKKGCQIYENSKVTNFQKDEDSDTFKLTTPEGVIVSRYLIHATHTPKGIAIKYHTSLGPYREYGVAGPLQKIRIPEGIFWMYKADEKYSFRSYQRSGARYLIGVGKSHKVGQADDNHSLMNNLISFMKENFSIDSISHSWGGQNYKPADLLPYIGPINKGAYEYVATGYSTDGLVYGTLSGLIISKIISEGADPYDGIFNASRISPIKGARNFTKENLNVAEQFLKDNLLGILRKDLDKISKGEGGIVKIGNENLAVYNEGGTYKAVAAKCTHLGCIVHWNNLEKSWDCPCHGSRFEINGKVIEGPALNDLELKKINNGSM